MPAYSYAFNNPVGMTDPDGLRGLEDGPTPSELKSPVNIDEECLAKCLAQVDPLNNNPITPQKPDSCEFSPAGHTPILLSPLPKPPRWWRPNASPFTSVFRYLNIVSRWLGGGAVFSGPTTKALGGAAGAAGGAVDFVEAEVLWVCTLHCAGGQ